MARPLSFDPHHNSVAQNGGGLAALRLIRSRKVGPATFHRLLAEHGSAEAALDALPRMAQDAGISDYQPCPVAVAPLPRPSPHSRRVRIQPAPRSRPSTPTSSRC